MTISKPLIGAVSVAFFLVCARVAPGQNLTEFYGWTLPYQEVNGLAIHGDIILGTVEEALVNRPDSRGGPPMRRLAPFPREVLWPGGVIPYTIDADVPRKENILGAIRTWDEQTVVQFVERTNEPDYLRFAVSEPSCHAVFGRGNGGESVMPIGPDGCSEPIMLHELGHAIGMGHEQQRTDRDRYVTVFHENLYTDDGIGNWHPVLDWGDPIGPYDYRSVMHYPFFSDDQRRHGEAYMMETIPPGMPMGQTVELSPGDIHSVARLYGHTPTRHTISTNPKGLQVVVDGQRLTAPVSFAWRAGEEHTVSVPSPQHRDNARYSFGRWSDDGQRTHTITTSLDTTLYQASFIAEHKIRTPVHPEGAGRVMVYPPNPDGYYRLRALVELSVEANQPYRFLRWSIDSDFWSDWYWRRFHGHSSNPARTHVTEGMVYEAHFTDGPILRLDSNLNPTTVVVDNWELETPVALYGDEFSSPTTVEVRPVNDWRRAYRHRFRSWSDGGEIRHSVNFPVREDTTLAVSLDGEYKLEANGWYGHEVSAVPSPDADGYYAEGTEVRLLAVERPPEQFIGWNGDVFGDDPTALVLMDRGRLAEAVFAAGTDKTEPGQSVNVSLHSVSDDLGSVRCFIRPPQEAGELRITFRVTSATPGAEAGLFVTHRRDPWPWDVEHRNADRVLAGGETTMTIAKPPLRWPAAYFILLRAAEGEGERTMNGTLTVSVD